MRIVFLLLTVCCLHVSANTFSQTVTFSGKNVPLKQVFAAIKQQTGYVVFSNRGDLEEALPVTAEARDMSLTDFLDMILKDQSLSYAIEDRTIMLRRNVNMFYELTDETVKGQVQDPNKRPLAGASVRVKGSRKGTVTDAEGRFSLNVQEGEVILISFMGFSDMALQRNGDTFGQLPAGRDNTIKGIMSNSKSDGLIIYMTPAENPMEEVVLKGYYTTTAKLSTSGISRVTSKDIEKQPVTSPLMALQGRVPGVEITPSSGLPGARQSIVIRGRNSLRTNGSPPLYIIDGIPVNSSYVISWDPTMIGFDPISTLNPANIETIDVLKDADATAIYGSRGANGVILITTKRNTRNGGTAVDVMAYRGFGQVPHKMKMLNTQEYLAMRREAFKNDGTTPSEYDFDMVLWDTTRYTDWQKVLLGNTSNISDIQASVSGGNDRTTFRLGTGYHKETLVTPGSKGYDRASASLNLNHTSANQRFKLNSAINYGLERHNKERGSISSAAFYLVPNAPALYTETGELNWELEPTYQYPTWTNPMALANSKSIANNRNLLANINLEYEVMPGLQLKMQSGYTDYSGDENVQTPFSSMNPLDRYAPDNPFGTKSSSDFGTNHRQSFILEPQVSYNRRFSLHNLQLLAGGTYQRSSAAFQRVAAIGYEADILLDSPLPAETKSVAGDERSIYKYVSVLARVGYDYNSKYLLNFTARRDGSSRFGPGKRYGNFGSAAAAWIFSDEPFVANNIGKVLTFGKLRAGYGSTGNDAIGDYQYYNLYYIAPVYQGQMSLAPQALYNPDFNWEVTRKLDMAIELGFADNRVMLEVNYYRNRSSNQLVNAPLPFTTGFRSIQINLPATIQNTGWEMVLQTDNLRSANLSWKSSVNLTIPRNKLTAFDNIESSPYRTIYQVGSPLDIQLVYRSLGVNTQTGLYEVEDLNKDGALDDNDKVFQQIYRRNFYGGLLNAVSYRRFELSFLFQFTKATGFKESGGGAPGAATNQGRYRLDNWKKPGDVSSVQRFSTSWDAIMANIRWGESNGNVEDRSFIRLKTLSFSWQLTNPQKTQKLLSDAKVFLQGQNLLTFSKTVNYDPETGMALPPLRIITLGLQVKI